MFTGAVCAVTTAVCAESALTGRPLAVRRLAHAQRRADVRRDDRVLHARLTADRHAVVAGSVAAQPCEREVDQGVPVHEPADLVSVSPATAVPVIVGGDTFDGVAAERASAPVVSRAATAAAQATSTAVPAKAPRSLP